MRRELFGSGGGDGRASGEKKKNGVLGAVALRRYW